MRQVKVFVNGVDYSLEAFPQGDALQKELAFLLWWGEKTHNKNNAGYVPAYSKYHSSPNKVSIHCPRVGGELVGIKKKGDVVFKIYLVD